MPSEPPRTDEPTPEDRKGPPAGDTPDEQALTRAAQTTSTGDGEIREGMSEAEIRKAGLIIDVPFEGASGKPERLHYADLGGKKKYKAKSPA